MSLNNPEQTLMGTAVAVACVVGLKHSEWLVKNTKKGRWLTERLGEKKALWSVRVFLVFGVLFGVLLAVGIVSPVTW